MTRCTRSRATIAGGTSFHFSSGSRRSGNPSSGGLSATTRAISEELALACRFVTGGEAGDLGARRDARCSPTSSSAMRRLDRQRRARVIAGLHRGERSGWCSSTVDRGSRSSRRELRRLGVDTYVSHSSVSLEERQRAEAAFAERGLRDRRDEHARSLASMSGTSTASSRSMRPRVSRRFSNVWGGPAAVRKRHRTLLFLDHRRSAPSCGGSDLSSWARFRQAHRSAATAVSHPRATADGTFPSRKAG